MPSSGYGTATGASSSAGSHAAYPDDADLLAFLTTAGLTADDTYDLTDLDLASAAVAGRRAFERETGRKMLAVSQVREFDPPTVPCGKLNLLADLATGGTITVTVDGEVLTEGTDYHLQPYNAPDDGLPYTKIRFLRYYAEPLYWSRLKIVEVEGPWGFGATIPDDAWEAMLAKAALIRAPQILAAIFQGVAGWKETNGVEERYNENPMSQSVKGWQDTYTEGVTSYARALSIF